MCGHLRRFCFFGLPVDNENLCTFQQNRGPEVMASSLKVYPSCGSSLPYRVPFWDVPSLLPKFMAHAVTPTTALGLWQHMVKSEGEGNQGEWRTATHCTTQTPKGTATLFMPVATFYKVYFDPESWTAIRVLIIIISPNSRVTSGCRILHCGFGIQDSPRVSKTCLDMCVTYAQALFPARRGNYLSVQKNERRELPSRVANFVHLLESAHVLFY